MKKYETLYKRTTTGKTQIWFMEQDGNKYRSTTGQLDGKKVTTEWTECEGKNVGRSNETSPIEQATAEIEAEYKKKQAQGKYSKDAGEIDIATFFDPMTAKTYEKHRTPTKAEFSAGIVYAQNKLDGMRCIVRNDGMWSRKGKPVVSSPHIHKALEAIFESFPGVVIDGELYNHDLKHDFEEIMSLARSSKPTAADIQRSAELLQFHVYDMYDPAYPMASFAERSASLLDMIKHFTKSDAIRIVPTHKVTSQQHLDRLYEEAVEWGYEGQMVRFDDGTPYEHKRSKSLLKRKDFIDDEFVIVDILPGKGNRATWASTMVVQLPDGRTSDAGIIGNAAYCQQLLQNKRKHIGSDATIKYFRLSADGKLMFAKCKHIWDGKRDA